MSIKDFIIYWKVVKKRLWLIGLLLVVTLGVIFLTSFLSKQVYKATTSFQVTAPLPAEVTIYSEFKTSSTIDELLRTRGNFVAVLQSKFVTGQVIEELGPDMGTDELLATTLVEPEEDSDFIDLKVTAGDPSTAAAIANTLMDNAAKYFGEMSAGSITANKEFIQQQLKEIRGELDVARAALMQFQIENRISSSEGLLNSQEDLITTLKTSRDEAQVESGLEAVAVYDELISKRERELQDLILLGSEYELLQDEVRRIKDVYQSLLDKETEAKLKENEIMSARFIQVIPASEPSHPLPRFEPKLFLLGAIVSLVLGIMLAFILEFLEHAETETDADGPAVLREAVTDSI